ncbi:unnamed protein product [Schistosoma intercalatum]|nr:unnamed protein product [Schistosoma intercalatum]
MSDNRAPPKLSFTIFILSCTFLSNLLNPPSNQLQMSCDEFYRDIKHHGSTAQDTNLTVVLKNHCLYFDYFVSTRVTHFCD